MTGEATRDARNERSAKSKKKSIFLGSLGVLGALALLFEPARHAIRGLPPFGSGEHTAMR